MTGYSIDERGNLVAVFIYNHNTNHKKVIVHPDSNKSYILHGLKYEPMRSIGAIGPNWTSNAGDSFVPATEDQLTVMRLLN